MSPAFVGSFRGFVEAIVVTILEAIVLTVTSTDFGPYTVLAPAVIFAIRSVEGVADHKIDPTKQRGLLGGKPEVGL